MKPIKCFLLIISLFCFSHSTLVAVDGSGSANRTGGNNWTNPIHPDTMSVMSTNPGDTFCIRGDATLSASLNMGSYDGGTVTRYKYICVKPGTTNWPPLTSDYAKDTADRPIWDLGASYVFTLGDSSNIYGLNIKGAANGLLVVGIDYYLKYCTVHHNQGTASTENTISNTVFGQLDSCLILSDNGNGCLGPAGTRFNDCKFVVAGIAIQPTGTQSLRGCTFINCRVCINTTADNNHIIGNCNFYSNDTVYHGTTDFGVSFIACAFKENGMEFVSDSQRNIRLRNNIIDTVNTTNIDTSGYGFNQNVIGDIGWIDIVGGNDSIPPASPAFNTGAW